jgi:preprotein translocase subunit SecG
MVFVQYLFMFLMLATAIFLIVLVLIQRGKGGGLAGALGGMGGQSAFGTKAGDLFTKITIGVASFWIILCIASVIILSRGRAEGPLSQGKPAQQAPAPQEPSPPAEKPASE